LCRYVEHPQFTHKFEMLGFFSHESRLTTNSHSVLIGTDSSVLKFVRYIAHTTSTYQVGTIVMRYWYSTAGTVAVASSKRKYLLELS
jgi:hypothetical protein